MKDPTVVPFPQAYQPTQPEPLLPPFSQEAREFREAIAAHPLLRRLFFALHDEFGAKAVRRAWDRIRCSDDRERFAEFFSK